MKPLSTVADPNQLMLRETCRQRVGGVSAIKYIGEQPNDDSWLNKVIRWMVEGRRQWQVRAAIFYGRRVPIEELRAAIEQDRDVDLSKIER